MNVTFTHGYQLNYLNLKIGMKVTVFPSNSALQQWNLTPASSRFYHLLSVLFLEFLFFLLSRSVTATTTFKLLDMPPLITTIILIFRLMDSIKKFPNALDSANYSRPCFFSTTTILSQSCKAQFFIVSAYDYYCPRVYPNDIRFIVYHTSHATIFCNLQGRSRWLRSKQTRACY